MKVVVKNNEGPSPAPVKMEDVTIKSLKIRARVTTDDVVYIENQQPGEPAVNEEIIPQTSTSASSSNYTTFSFEVAKQGKQGSHIIYEVTSPDGFKAQSSNATEVWQQLFDAVQEARLSQKMSPLCYNSLGLSGLQMLGLTHSALQYLLEQLPGAKPFTKYTFKHHAHDLDEVLPENPSGCTRSEPFKTRKPYDIFSWLASKHRRRPEIEVKIGVDTENHRTSNRRATSLELPMAMRFRHLRETAKEAVGVYRSHIHGRGLFCKRVIEAGEMVIEYAGEVIRAVMTDKREHFYESKGIGCYMFKIDDQTVIDATLHGNAARFINHSCDPNCYSRIVDILGKKHIIIFALRRIFKGEELTYDYKFPIEEDKITCTCGARRCRKYLN